MADDVAALGFDVDSKPLADAAVAADRLSVSAKKLEQSAQGTAQSTTLAATATQRLSAEMQQATRIQQAHAAVTGELSSRLAGVSANAGLAGSALRVLGPIGIAVAAAIGGAVIVLGKMVDLSHQLAQKAQELKQFADATGLTTLQVQALRSEATKFGVSSEEAQTAIQNFTARFNELRLGSGDLLTQIRKISPALAEQMQTATSSAEAITLFGKALQQTDDIFQRNALMRAATGRGGISAAQFMSGLNMSKLTQGFEESGKALDDRLLRRIAQLEIDIQKTSAKARQAVASIFAEPVLQAQLRYVRGFSDFAQTAKNFTISDALKLLLNLTPGSLLAHMISGKPIIPTPSGGGMVAPTDPMAEARRRLAQGLAAGQRGTTELAGFFDPNAALTLEAQVEKLKKLTEVLGQAATPSEQLRTKLKELELAARDAGLGTDVLGRAQRALKEEFAVNQLREQVSALGSASTITEQYNLRLAELKQKLDQGQISQETFNRAVQGLITDRQIQQMRDTVSAVGSLATPTEQYRLRVAELQQQLDRGAISQDTFNRAVLAANPIFQQLTQSAAQFATTLIQGLTQGGSLMTNLSHAATQLGNSLISGGFAQIAQGNIATGGIMAVVGAGLSIFGSNQQRQQQQRQQQTQNFNDILTLQMRGATAGLDTTTRAGALASFDARAVQERVQAIQAGSTHMVELERALAAERLTINKDFDKREAEQEKANREAVLARQKSFLDREFAAGTDTSTFSGAMAAFERKAAQERLDEQAAGGQASVELERALAAEKLQIEIDFAKKDEEIRKAAIARQQGFQDQLFVTLQDQTTLAGQLAVFDLQAQRDREREIEAGGQAINDLEALQMAQRFNIIEDFTKKAVEAEKQAAQDRQNAINSAAKNIVDYLNGLMSGPASTLSPQTVLANAQAVYNANLVLAQQGNIDAQNKFTQLADNLEKAARAFYGSSTSYQAIRNQIISQGLALPAVQATDDPTVIAMRDVLTELQNGHLNDINFNTDPIPLIKPAIDADKDAVAAMHATLAGAVQASIDAGNASAIATALSTYFSTLDTNVNGLLDFSEFSAGLAGMASNAQLRAMFMTLDTDNSGSLSKLELIQAATGGVKINTDPYQAISIAQWGKIANDVAVGINQILNSVNSQVGVSAATLQDVRQGTDFLSSFAPILRAVAFNTRGSIEYAAPSSSQVPYSNNIWGLLTAARGGWIEGGIAGMDSVRAMLMPGEHVTNAVSAQANRSLLDLINGYPGSISLPPVFVPYANDNDGSIAELRGLREEISSLRRENASLLRYIANCIAESDANASGALKSGFDKLGLEMRQNRTVPKRNGTNG